MLVWPAMARRCSFASAGYHVKGLSDRWEDRADATDAKQTHVSGIDRELVLGKCLTYKGMGWGRPFPRGKWFANGELSAVVSHFRCTLREGMNDHDPFRLTCEGGRFFCEWLKFTIKRQDLQLRSVSTDPRHFARCYIFAGVMVLVNHHQRRHQSVEPGCPFF